MLSESEDTKNIYAKNSGGGIEFLEFIGILDFLLNFLFDLLKPIKAFKKTTIFKKRSLNNKWK